MSSIPVLELSISLPCRVCRWAFSWMPLQTPLTIGLDPRKVEVADLSFSIIYGGLTGFSASVIRSPAKLLAQHGVKGLDTLRFDGSVLFIIMPNFFLIWQEVSCHAPTPLS